MNNSDTYFKVLLVDDDDEFRQSLAERLRLRGYEVLEDSCGEYAVMRVRADRSIDVVILDYKMPGMDGKQTLQELKVFRPEIQVVMLTGFGSVGTARKAGKLGVFRYFSKPVNMDELLTVIQEAGHEKINFIQHQDMPVKVHSSRWSRVVGSHNSRPLIIRLGLMSMLVTVLVPPPERLTNLLNTPKNDLVHSREIIGYPYYSELSENESIATYYVNRYKPPGLVGVDGLAIPAARRAFVMIGLILVAALFWASGAVPIGITALIVAIVMYAAGIMKPDAIAQAFAKDSVFFIFGILALSRVIMSTGLDRRIAMLLLLPVKNLWLLLFVFLPVFSLTCSFISESILIALMMPVFIAVYHQATKDAPRGEHRQLMVMFALMLCYASNVGGPGSPAAGGRNAVMIGILGDYGQGPTFVQWMKYGLPFVPVAGLMVGLYFFVVFRGKTKNVNLDIAYLARQSSKRLGPMNRDEHIAAGVLLLVVGLWIFGGQRVGMGGPALLGLVLLNMLGVMKWSEISKIHWDVVFLYAGASALGTGLAVTGGALYVAQGLVGALPGALMDGTAFGGALGHAGLPMAVSFITGLVTNIMSDGAAVAAVGPIAVSSAQSAGLHPWALGFATAFASSFPHMLIIGTPANALVFVMCRDPQTGSQLVTRKDFLIHGSVVFVISFVVLWGWTFLGYWRWLGL